MIEQYPLYFSQVEGVLSQVWEPSVLQTPGASSIIARCKSIWSEVV